jgi:hypothetical protein
MEFFMLSFFLELKNIKNFVDKNLKPSKFILFPLFTSAITQKKSIISSIVSSISNTFSCLQSLRLSNAAQKAERLNDLEASILLPPNDDSSIIFQKYLRGKNWEEAKSRKSFSSIDTFEKWKRQRNLNCATQRNLTKIP